MGPLHEPYHVQKLCRSNVYAIGVIAFVCDILTTGAKRYGLQNVPSRVARPSHTQAAQGVTILAVISGRVQPHPPRSGTTEGG